MRTIMGSSILQTKTLIVFASLKFICCLEYPSESFGEKSRVSNISHTCKYQERNRVYKCDGRGTMNAIPKIPVNARTLDITNGNFSNVTGDTFKTLVKSSVRILRMENCRIGYITKDAFVNISLEELYLLKNNGPLNASVLAASFYSLNGSKIQTMSLSNMGWDSLPTYMFHGLEPSNISSIILKENVLHSVDGNIFRNLSNLKSINLDWNPILDNNINFEGLSQITDLSLKGTLILFFPNFCDRNNKSYTPKLQTLSLDYSNIHSLYKKITCLDHIRTLHLNGLSLRLLYNNTFSELKSLQRLYLKNIGSQFKYISQLAFNSSSLRQLSFSVTGDFGFRDNNVNNFHPPFLFQNSPKLTFLNMSFTRFTLSDKYWKQIFQPLKKLRVLALKNVQMQYLPLDIGNIFENLRELDLASNKITYWTNSGPFKEFKSLRSLNLRGNRISVINETSFPDVWITGKGPLRGLMLVGNPFSCTCDMIWLRDWMDKLDSRNITTDKQIWKCAISGNMVLSYHPLRTFPCLVADIVPSLAGLFVILTTAFICYIFRFRIKLQFYRLMSRRRFYRRIVSGDHLYDCFVAYSYADLTWIQSKCIPKLEVNNNRRLCIRDRDFSLGTVFSNHIIENIEASSAVLLVLSEEFAKDNWCNFQMAIALHLNITDRQPAIIPIILNKISFRHLKEPIYKVVSTMKCYVWSEGDTAEEHFWMQVLADIPLNVHNEGVSNNMTHDSLNQI